MSYSCVAACLPYLALEKEAANGEVMYTDDTPVKILSCLKEDQEEKAPRERVLL